MKYSKLKFEVLFNSDLKDFCQETTLKPIDKKKVVGLANDFESRKWRLSQFHEFIWNNIAETALTKQEREALIDSPESLTLRAAKNLRLTDSEKDIGKGSEIAEIFLYGVMKHFYHALPVVPKIYHKQNVQDNAKGADSVHIVLDESESKFSIWFGEAKFYSDIENTRFGTIIESVENSLSDDKLKKENAIILGLNELSEHVADSSTYNRIKELLDNATSLDKLKPLLHIPILLLYECSITKNNLEFTEKYKEEVIAFQKGRAEAYFKKQIEKLNSIFKYSEIHFHLILFPVPSKENIVTHFIDTVSRKKEAAKND